MTNTDNGGEEQEAIVVTDAPEEMTERSLKEHVRNFSGILDKIEALDDKKRQLWREIYENAITDRQYAFAMFNKLVNITEDKSSEHAVHGRAMSSYLERMSRANDQLIKLADLIARVEQGTEHIDADDMFKRIDRSRGQR